MNNTLATSMGQKLSFLEYTCGWLSAEEKGTDPPYYNPLSNRARRGDGGLSYCYKRDAAMSPMLTCLECCKAPGRVMASANKPNATCNRWISFYLDLIVLGTSIQIAVSSANRLDSAVLKWVATGWYTMTGARNHVCSGS